jgi:hypothetical protein
MHQPASSQWNEFTIRETTAADPDVILHHRQSMFSDMGYNDERSLVAMASASRPLYEVLGFTPTNEMRLMLR